ncbi:MAG: leucine-rich repeat protein [Oscillospiraceae bacterium]|nr:leucine-rich repeat protein [Oscillospiraceae bacterium]
MKKRLLSLVLTICMLMPMFAIPQESAPMASAATASDKAIMEEYIRTLTEAEYIKYSQLPFEEYNDQVWDHVWSKNIFWEAVWKTINDLGSGSYKEAFATLCGQSTFQTKEMYSVLSDYLAGVTSKSSAEKDAADFKEDSDPFVDYNKKIIKILGKMDDENKKKEVSKIYEQTSATIKDGKILFAAANEGVHAVAYVQKMICIATDNYVENAKYIDVICDYVDEEVKRIKNSPSSDASQIKYANDMLLATAELKTSYYNGFIAALKEIDKSIIKYGSKWAKEGVKKFIKELGGDAVLGVFNTVDTVFFIKDMLMEMTGAGDKINASSKVQCSLPLALGFQNKFYSEGKKRLADGNFSDEDYEYMKALFDLCRSAQTSNYKYLDAQINDKWVDATLKELDKSKNSALSDVEYMQRFTDYAKGKFDINENVSEIDGEFNGHSYKFIISPMDIPEAERWCESVGGYLAVMNSEVEWEYIENIIDTVNYYDKEFLLKCNWEVNRNYTHILGKAGGYEWDIYDNILDGSYKRYNDELGAYQYLHSNEWKVSDGYFFVCEWDTYDSSKQTVKEKIKGQVGDNLYWDMEKGVLTFSGSGAMWDSVLTDEEFEKGTTSKNHIDRYIDGRGYYYATHHWTEATKVIFPKGMTTIGRNAFAFSNGNDLITEIILPESLVSIGEGAFSGCKNLKRINLPKNLKYIGNGAFQRCTSLEEISIPSGTKIGNNAFAECSSLKSVNIIGNNTTDGNATINYRAFADCISLENVVISNGVKTIGQQAFYRCENLKNISMPDMLEEIGLDAFWGCKQLTKIKIPDKVKKICNGAFSFTAIKEIVLPKSVSYIGNNAFFDCALEKIYILNSACDIGGMVDKNYQKVFLNVFGYTGSTAEKWVKSRTGYTSVTGKPHPYTFIPITSSTVIPDIQNPEIASPDVPTAPTTPETPTPDYSNNPGGFSDVRTGDSFANAVVNMVSKGVINGYPDKSFRPNGTLTRAEAAAIICRLNGNFDLATTNTKFTDAPKNNWASGYIAKANQLGIIDGVGNNKYNPNGTLTGEQWVKMAVCWLGLENDAKYYGGWPDGYVTVAKEHNILKNVVSTNLKSNMSRADACIIADNTLPLKGKVAPSKPKVETKPTTQTVTKNETQFDPTSLVPYQDSVTRYWGYKDKQGNIVIKAQYYSAYEFNKYGLAKVSYLKPSSAEDQGGIMYGIINEENKRIVDIKYMDLHFCGNGLITFGVIQGRRSVYGLFDKEGKMVIEPTYEMIDDFAINGLAVVLINNQYGYINIEGKLVIEPKFRWAFAFDESGRALVVLNDEQFYINEKGERVS